MIRRHDFVHIHLHKTLTTYIRAWLCLHTWFVDMTLSTYIYTIHSFKYTLSKGHVFVHIHDSSIWLCSHTWIVYTWIVEAPSIENQSECFFHNIASPQYSLHDGQKVSAWLCSQTWIVWKASIIRMNSLYMNTLVSLRWKKKWTCVSQNCRTTKHDLNKSFAYLQYLCVSYTCFGKNSVCEKSTTAYNRQLLFFCKNIVYE